MSIEQLNRIAELERRIAVLEAQVKLLAEAANRKTLTLKKANG